MFSRTLQAASAALLSCCCSCAFAAGDASSFALGTRFGLTTGLGFEATYGLNRWLDLRAAYNIGYIEFDDDDEGVNYRAKLDYRSAAGFLDIKPFAGGFRISAGLYSNPLKVDLNAAGLDDYELGDSTYYGDLALDGRVRLGTATPYLGIGWGGTTNGKGFGASLDFGVQFTKSADVRLRAGGRACQMTGDTPCNPNGAEGFDVEGSDPRAVAFQRDLDQEIRDLEDDAKDFKLMPVFQIGLQYRFGGGRSADAQQQEPASAQTAAPPLSVEPRSSPAPASLNAGPLVLPKTLRLRSRPLAALPQDATSVSAGTPVTVSQRLDGNDGVWWFVDAEGTSGWAQEAELLP